MALISQTMGWVFLLAFGISMILITYIFARIRKSRGKEGFLVAGRRLHWLVGGPSIAASWIWAGALFVSVQMAYEKGLPGIFWFTFPNIVALGIFAILGPSIRKKFGKGYTLPQFIRDKLGSSRVHKLYLVPFLFGQLIAITFNIFAGASLVSLITGLALTTVMPVLAVIALAYTLISGLEASVITDFIQISLILLGILLIIPMAIGAAGGFGALGGGLGGISGGFRNIFDPGVAFSFGIVTSIGLISQTIADQQYWQRTFALKKKHISKAFVFGAILFAIVPVSLSLLGFLGANTGLAIHLPEGTDSSMIGVLTVSQLLPGAATLLFIVMLLAGLSSTIDSGISATSSLWATDVLKYSKKEKEILRKQHNSEMLTNDETRLARIMDRRVIRKSRNAMIGMTALGLVTAYMAHFVAGFGLNQLFMLSISIAASVSVPTVLSIYWDKLSAKGVFYGVLISIVVGMPLFIYGNVINDPGTTVVASFLMILISTLVCLGLPRKT